VLVVLAHVLAAFWYVTGYVGTNLCTEMARRSTSDDDCRSALLISGRLDRWANRTGGTAVGITGLLLIVVYGRSIMTPWILASTLLFGGVILAGIFLWERFGGGVEDAAEAGDWAAVRRTLNTPRAIAYGRVENLAVLAIVVLMVLGPR